MFATLTTEDASTLTELKTFTTLDEALTAIAASATWMAADQRLQLLESENADGTGTWERRADLESYYGTDTRIRREASASATGRLLATYRTPGTHPTGERGFILTGDPDLADHVHGPRTA